MSTLVQFHERVKNVTKVKKYRRGQDVFLSLLGKTLSFDFYVNPKAICYVKKGCLSKKPVSARFREDEI